MELFLAYVQHPANRQKWVSYFGDTATARFGHLPNRLYFDVHVTAVLGEREPEGPRFLRFILNGPGITRTIDRTEWNIHHGSNELRTGITVDVLTAGSHTISAQFEGSMQMAHVKLAVEHKPAEDRP